MIKNTVLAISTIAMLGVSAPAMAGAFGDTDDASWVADNYQASLQERGINATKVFEWGDYIQASVKLADGTTEFQYFTTTLEQVAL